MNLLSSALLVSAVPQVHRMMERFHLFCSEVTSLLQLPLGSPTELAFLSNMEIKMSDSGCASSGPESARRVPPAPAQLPAFGRPTAGDPRGRAGRAPLTHVGPRRRRFGRACGSRF